MVGRSGRQLPLSVPSPLSFSGFWLARSHWAAPERLHPGGRARPLLITYERTKSRTNEIYGGRYGPEARGEAAGDTTASSHTSRDENPDSRRPRFEGARSGFQGYSSKQQRKVYSDTEHICGEGQRHADAPQRQPHLKRRPRSSGALRGWPREGRDRPGQGPHGNTELKAEAREGLSAEAPAPGARTPAPQSPSRGRALLESIAARDASEMSQLREALVAETERADEAEAFASSFVDRNTSTPRRWRPRSTTSSCRWRLRSRTVTPRAGLRLPLSRRSRPSMRRSGTRWALC